MSQEITRKVNSESESFVFPSAKCKAKNNRDRKMYLRTLISEVMRSAFRQRKQIIRKGVHLSTFVECFFASVTNKHGGIRCSSRRKQIPYRIRHILTSTTSTTMLATGDEVTGRKSPRTFSFTCKG